MVSTSTNFNLIKWSRVDPKHAVAVWIYQEFPQLPEDRRQPRKFVRVKMVGHLNAWFIMTASQQLGKKGIYKSPTAFLKRVILVLLS
jgi:hypothetical protein